MQQEGEKRMNSNCIQLMEKVSDSKGQQRSPRVGDEAERKRSRKRMRKKRGIYTDRWMMRKGQKREKAR